MLTSFIGWVKGLSKAGKVAFAVVGFTAAGAMAAPATNPVNTDPQVKAEQTSKEPVITTETITETEDIPFSKQTVETSTLPKGVDKLTTAGVNGTRTITYRITKTDGLQTAKDKINTNDTTAPVDEITSLGTYEAPTPPPAPRNNCDPNYSPCVPLVSYDLDCPDVGFSVTVIGSDPHRFDREGDGYGCESY